MPVGNNKDAAADAQPQGGQPQGTRLVNPKVPLQVLELQVRELAIKTPRRAQLVVLLELELVPDLEHARTRRLLRHLTGPSTLRHLKSRSSSSRLNSSNRRCLQQSLLPWQQIVNRPDLLYWTWQHQPTPLRQSCHARRRSWPSSGHLAR